MIKTLLSPRIVPAFALALVATGCPSDSTPASEDSTSGSTSGDSTAAVESTTSAADTTSDGSTTVLGDSTSTSISDSSTAGDDESSTGSAPIECTTLRVTNTELLGGLQDGQMVYGMTVQMGAEILSDRLLLLLTTDDTGTFEFGAGNNASIETCEQCMAVLADIDPSFGPSQTFLATMGTIEIDASTPPLSSESLVANWAGVHLEEVNAATLGPIRGGDCIDLVDTAVTGATSVEGWTCPIDYFGGGDGCDCGCGVVDPDCADETAASCQYCVAADGSCVPEGMACADAVLADDNSSCNLPALWTCDLALLDAGDGVCNCGCAVLDPDCDSPFVIECDTCSDTGSCAEAEADCDLINPTASGSCLSVPGWTCNAQFYDGSDGCDCGCGIPDPDCADATAGSCEYCGNPGSCAPQGSACPSIITADNNAVCTPGAAWTCDAALYGAGDDQCDCGCGVPDPDCEGPQGVFCDVCDGVGSCGEDLGGCAVTAHPTENYLCL